MAGTVTKYNSDNRNIERDPCILVFDYLAEEGADKDEDVTLRAMPANCIYLWMQIQCIQADIGATTSTLTLKHGTTAILTGASDNGGTIDMIQNGVVVATQGTQIPSADTSAAANLVARFDGVDTSTTAAKYRILVCVMRATF